MPYSIVLICVCHKKAGHPKHSYLKCALSQYKNGLASVKNMLVLKLPPFSPYLHGKGKRAAISKLACVLQKRICSYIVLALKNYVHGFAIFS